MRRMVWGLRGLRVVGEEGIPPPPHAFWMPFHVSRKMDTLSLIFCGKGEGEREREREGGREGERKGERRGGRGREIEI